MALWPQWRSALIWDFWAILSYILFSLLFWYVGLIPDLATLRDRAKGTMARTLFGIFALGWRGSARHWHTLHIYHMTMACLGVPLVVSLHSVVGLDFAASLMPGWAETIFPPYFVVGAMYSGFAMVVVLAAAVRWGLRMQALITIEHFEVMAKMLLAASIDHDAVLLHRMVHGLVRRRARRAPPRRLCLHRRLPRPLLADAGLQLRHRPGLLVSARRAAALPRW